MSEKSEKKHFNLITCLLGTIYIFLFLIITTPLVLFLGPYDNTRKAFISTLLATRHEYLLTDFFSKETLNKMMGIEEEPIKEKEVVQNIENIEIKHSTSTEIERYDINTDRYNAYILEIKNPLKIKVAMTKYLGKTGQKTSEMARDNNAIAAINGGAFVDKSNDGTLYAGTGAIPGGFVISGGKLLYPQMTDLNSKNKENVIAFTKEGQLVVGSHSYDELMDMNVQEGMCFRPPNIIINGVKQIKDKMAEGLNPRTAIGQKEDGTVIFLVIDGRKISNPGASLYDVQEIMASRGAVNAAALDGGYSSTMYYKDEVINSPNAWDGERSVATAFYVEE